MKIAALTDIGSCRQENQDNYCARQLVDGTGWGLVCDGMGGANGGRVASTLATQTMLRYFDHSLRTIENGEEKAFMMRAFDNANRAVYEKATSDPEVLGMGTTGVCALQRGNLAHIVHAGDSRAYLWHGGAIRQLTRDHSMVQQLVDSGQITREQAALHPQKNLITRALTGIIFVAVLVGAIYFHSYYFLAVFGLITGLSLWEFYGLVKHYENAAIKRFVSSLGGAYLFAATFGYANGLVGGNIFLPYLLFLMYTMITELYDKASNPINNWALTLFGQIYCAGSFSLLNFITSVPNTPGEIVHIPYFALAIFVFVWVNDTGAYLVGSMLGKRRLFERISPKKSWEGFYGGLAFVLITSQIFAWFMPATNWYTWLGLAGTIVVFGTWGDLIESLMKRTLGVKDSGHVLPGHGGMLDRFDSVMMAIPAAYIYIELFIRN